MASLSEHSNTQEPQGRRKRLAGLAASDDQAGAPIAWEAERMHMEREGMRLVWVDLHGQKRVGTASKGWGTSAGPLASR